MTDIDRAILVLVNMALYPRQRFNEILKFTSGLTRRVLSMRRQEFEGEGLTRRYRYLRSGNETSAFGRVNSWGCNKPFGYCFVKRLFALSTISLDP